MGQYYKPIILGDEPKEGEHETIKAWMYSHDYGNGLKLMEHSWIKNLFVSTFEKLLTKRGGYYKSRVVWGGDYADKEHNTDGNLYGQCKSDNPSYINPKQVNTHNKFQFIVNHSKKLFVDKTKVPVIDGWAIHPLPLLTCEGNGGGGGDYFGEDPNQIVGSWARDIISVEKENPKNIFPTFDYSELIFDLVENM